MIDFKLPFGLRNNELVHISEVEKGLKCNCICPACRSPLIARKGVSMKHHFAHASSVKCSKGIETALHMAAKEILLSHKRIYIPKVEVELTPYLEKILIAQESVIYFTEVKLEYILDDIIPDVYIIVNGRTLLIEITVTHRTEEPKLNKIKQMGTSCLEIDLSKVDRDITFESLKHYITEDCKVKKWLFNAKANAYKQQVLIDAVKKPVIQKGLDLLIEPCPHNVRLHRAKSYADLTDDCLFCNNCVHVEFEPNGIQSIYCRGHKPILKHNVPIIK